MPLIISEVFIALIEQFKVLANNVRIGLERLERDLWHRIHADINIANHTALSRSDVLGLGMVVAAGFRYWPVSLGGCK